MLNPEQISLRLRDAEITRLKAENERQAKKIKNILASVVGLIREIAKQASYQHKAQLMGLADELERDV